MEATGGGGPVSGLGDPESTVDGPGGGGVSVVGVVGVVRGRGLRLVTGLGTIAGVDRRPSQLLGWGYLHAELARRLSATRHAGWWYVLLDSDGTPLDVGPLRRRPTRAWTTGPVPGYRDVQVWLQVTRPELSALLEHPPPGWAPLLADLVNRIAHRPAGPPTTDPTDRFPNAGLRRWIHIRDQACTFPGCRVAAHRCEVDHTIEHAHGGPTTDRNLMPACGPDHDLKTRHGWTARQTAPGHVTWTSPLGHHYPRTPPPAPPPTAPIPHSYPADDPWLPGEPYQRPHWQTHTCLTVIEPPPPAPEPEPPPPPPAHGDPPF